MATFTYPTSVELSQIEQVKVPVLTQDDPIFRIMPVTTKDAAVVSWEQQDNFTGLQAVRGLGGKPSRVNRVGAKRYVMEPGFYGEFQEIDEQELMHRRRYGSFDQPIDISDLVMEAQDQLLGRRIDRIRQIGWTLITTGTFSVSHPLGGVMHTDTYSLQTASFSNWSSASAGTPLIDFRTAKLLSRGKSVNFGRNATAYLNQITFNKLAKNTNTADLGGKKTTNISNISSLKDINSWLLDEDLPQIEIYDEGYQNDSDVFVPFIGDNVTVIVGHRTTGASVAEYRMVRNVNNPGMEPGAYQKVIDHGEDDVPRVIEVHDGHNGGPAIFFPSAVIVCTNT